MGDNIVALDSLVGEHELSGVDFGSTRVNTYGTVHEDANQMRFVLDGEIYVVTEDPCDGYRSSMGSFELVDGPPVENTFPPVKVVGRMRTKGSYGQTDDVLSFIVASSGEVVLEAGTEATDDYYPCYIAFFDPKALGEKR